MNAPNRQQLKPCPAKGQAANVNNSKIRQSEADDDGRKTLRCAFVGAILAGKPVGKNGK